jgi:hypothetical protein
MEENSKSKDPVSFTFILLSIAIGATVIYLVKRIRQAEERLKRLEKEKEHSLTTKDIQEAVQHYIGKQPEFLPPYAGQFVGHPPPAPQIPKQPSAQVPYPYPPPPVPHHPTCAPAPQQQQQQQQAASLSDPQKSTKKKKPIASRKVVPRKEDKSPEFECCEDGVCYPKDEKAAEKTSFEKKYPEDDQATIADGKAEMTEPDNVQLESMVNQTIFAVKSMGFEKGSPNSEFAAFAMIDEDDEKSEKEEEMESPRVEEIDIESTEESQSENIQDQPAQ